LLSCGQEKQSSPASWTPLPQEFARVQRIQHLPSFPLLASQLSHCSPNSDSTILFPHLEKQACTSIGHVWHVSQLSIVPFPHAVNELHDNEHFQSFPLLADQLSHCSHRLYSTIPFPHLEKQACTSIGHV
jgi:hypothetical protein